MTPLHEASDAVENHYIIISTKLDKMQLYNNEKMRR